MLFDLPWSEHLKLFLQCCDLCSASCPQAPGGEAGEHEEERHGERPLAVPALWGDAGAAGQLLCLLPGLQKGGFGHTCLFLAAELSRKRHQAPWKLESSAGLTDFILIGAVRPLSFLLQPRDNRRFLRILKCLSCTQCWDGLCQPPLHLPAGVCRVGQGAEMCSRQRQLKTEPVLLLTARSALRPSKRAQVHPQAPNQCKFCSPVPQGLPVLCVLSTGRALLCQQPRDDSCCSWLHSRGVNLYCCGDDDLQGNHLILPLLGAWFSCT